MPTRTKTPPPDTVPTGPPQPAVKTPRRRAAADKKTPGPGLPDRDHLDGCPGNRVETHTQTGPKGTVTVTRCIDCGGQTSKEP